MVKDKIQFCPACNVVMKYCGSRVWHCKQCKTRYHYDRVPDIEEHRFAGIVSRIFHGWHYHVHKWKMK